MAKSPNRIPTVEVTLSLNTRTAWYLDRLVDKGLYGNSRAEAAKVLIYDHCKLLIGQKKLEEFPVALPAQQAVIEN